MSPVQPWITIETDCSSTENSVLPVRSESIPTDLAEQERWVGFDIVQNEETGKFAKTPVDINTWEPASCSDLDTWCDLEMALEAYEEGEVAAIGIALGDLENGQRLCGLDYDNCRDPETGQIDATVLEFVRAIPGYYEVSPSGTGIKGFFYGRLPRGRRVFELHNGIQVEMYDSGRFFVVTGHVLEEYSSEIEDRSEELARFHGGLEAQRRAKRTPQANESARPRSGDHADRSLIRSALAALDPRRADNYQDWTGVGMALKDEDPDNFDLWDEWSQLSGKYQPGECAEKWATFNGEGLGLGSLFHWAKEDGWQQPVTITTSDNDLPEVMLPGGGQTVTAAAERLGELLADQGEHFVMGGKVVRLDTEENAEAVFRPVKASELVSDFERVARLMKISGKGDQQKCQPVVCSKGTAETISESRMFKEKLPRINAFSGCPLLVERNGELVEVSGYDSSSGILARGEAPLETTLEEARGTLNDLLDDFRFATPGDRSRALSSLITPALVKGHLLSGRAPIDLCGGDQSQAGKGYRNKITGAIYGATPRTIAQQRGGVGSLEESFDSALTSGSDFISFDNLRGKVNSQKLESFLTEDTYNARASYQRNTPIDPRQFVVMLTSNAAEMTRDLANRCSCVKILKQPEGYEYACYEEGDLLDHVRANQPRYLGAVFAVVRAWYEAGKRRTQETRHDFRGWARTLDWIVQNLLGAAPLLDGHRETQRRMTTPELSWLRDLALAVVERDLDRDLLANDLVDIASQHGDIEIPGLQETGSLDDEDVRRSIHQQMGRRLGRCFCESDRVEIDGMTIERIHFTDSDSHQRRSYRFSRS